MFKKYRSYLLIFLLPVMACMTCKKEDRDTCLSYQKASVASVTGVHTAMINEEITLAVSFPVGNGCGDFSSFDEITAGNIISVTVNAKYLGCVCTQDLPTRVASYRFKKTVAGTYELRFYQDGGGYISYSIVVS